jgi:cell wall-associated NlpC family hydrolase
MSAPSLSGTGSGVSAGGRTAAATPEGRTSAGQTPDVAEVHAHDAPPPPARPVAAGAGLRLAAGGSAPRRSGRCRPSRPSAGGHRRPADQHTRPAPPTRANAPRVGTAPADLTAILNETINTILNGNLNAAAALNGNLNAALAGGGMRGRVRAQPMGKPYELGAEGPNAYDCSGLVWRAWQHAGLDWERMTAAGQWQWLHSCGHDLPGTRLRRGDLLFYANDFSRSRLDPPRRHGRRPRSHGRAPRPGSCPRSSAALGRPGSPPAGHRSLDNQSTAKGAPHMPQTHTPTAPVAPPRVRTIIAYTGSGVDTIEGQRAVQRQRTAIQAEADFQGWTVAAWTCDLGQPGDTLDRCGLKQALALLAEHKADALVAYEDGRLASQGSHRRQLERLAQRQGWRLLTVQTLRTPTQA